MQTFFYDEITQYIYRSSHQRRSIKIGVLKNFAKFTGKHLCQSLFFNKVASLRTVISVLGHTFLYLTLLKKRLWHRPKTCNFTVCRNILLFARNAHVVYLFCHCQHDYDISILEDQQLNCDLKSAFIKIVFLKCSYTVLLLIMHEFFYQPFTQF